MNWMLLVAGLWPLLLAPLVISGRLAWLVPLAPLPALAAVWLVPDGGLLPLPWLLLGTQLGLDAISRIFLLFTALLWLVAGLSGVSDRQWGGVHGGRFRFFFLLAMAGNLWLIVGQDLASFYLGFAVMGLASYGLIIHAGGRRVLRAGRVYLALTLVGEVLLFMGLVLIAAQTGTLTPTPAQLATLDDLSLGLMILGLGVKAGLVPLHVWLPLAHPAAPVPASAVLSGAMIKVALLGWLRYLPIGEAALPEWGLLFVFVGLATAYYALPIGLVQSDPKVLLAYSSISKMGLLAAALGLVLIEPDRAPLVVTALALYAGHHALVKGGLFLGVGLRRSAPAQPLVLGGMILLALSLAGVPLTSGAVGKYGLKPAFTALDWSWLDVAVALVGIATALLMVRFMWSLWRIAPAPQRRQGWALGAWVAMLLLVLLYPLVLGSPQAWATNSMLALMAVLVAIPVILAARLRPWLLAPLRRAVPAGDLLALARPLLVAVKWTLRDLGRAAQRRGAHLARRLAALAVVLWRRPQSPLDRWLAAWPVAGLLWLAIMAALILPVLL